MERKTTFSLKHRVLALLAGMVLLGAQSANASVGLTALEGTGGTGGEGYAKLVDGQISTKWCQKMDEGNPYVVFKADEAIVPVNYYLVTGNDTGSYPGRNWTEWQIFGANFASDEEATGDASAWVLIDEKTKVAMPPFNQAAADFTFSTNPSEAYKYFKIVVKEIASLDETTMQMSEFSFGSSSENGGIIYTPLYCLEQDRLNDDEGPGMVFDGQTTTKWGCHQFEGGDYYGYDWLVFKTSRPIQPTYYIYTTANDNASYTGRNWKTWKIYGGNFASDAEAQRDAQGWELIDNKVDVGSDVLPDANYTPVVLNFSESVTKAYTYFRIEISAVQGTNVYMQISEFSLGDEAAFDATRQQYYNQYAAFNMDRPFDKSLIEEYNAALAEIYNVTTPDGFKPVLDKLNDIQTKINTSASSYQAYAVIVQGLRNSFEKGTLTAEGNAIVGPYLNENIAPNGTYPNGSYAYIIEHCTLSADELNEEGSMLNNWIASYSGNIGEPIRDVTYEGLAGTPGFNDSESYPSLFDGDSQTKWCAGADHYATHGGRPFYVIFKASEAIAPTWYTLCTSNDTQSDSGPSRNWTTWTVYGANFDSDDAAIASYNITNPVDNMHRPSSAWNVIDKKEGYTLLPNENYAPSVVFMTDPSDTPYQYFLIEIFENYADNTIQMSYIDFGNQANVFLLRDETYDEFKDYDLNVEAQQALKDDYTKALARLKNSASINDIVGLRAQLETLQADIETSIETYISFREAVDELESWRIDFPEGSEDWETYLDENVAPQSVDPSSPFAYGSSKYILENFNASNAELNNEISRINTFIGILSDPDNFMVLWGNMNTFGDNENWAKLLDKKYTSEDGSKWCGTITEDIGGNASVIFKTLRESQPVFYKLVTGNDTEGNSGRNWKSWQIYGGNFSSDAEATPDAEGWVLMDSKEGVGQDRLPAANYTTAYFGFSEGNQTPYKYYKIVVTEAYSGSTIQMAEFLFGDEDDFAAIKDEYSAAARKFNPTKMHAQNALIDDYDAFIDAIEDSEGIEELLVNYNTAIAAQEAIKASDQAYGLLKLAVDDAKTFLEENPLEESEALDILTEYLEEYGDADETYPNGTFTFIYEEQELDTETVLGELDFLEQLKAAAVAVGYSAGVEITSIVTNPRFTKYTSEGGLTFDGWEGQGFSTGTNAEGLMSAVEFCEDKSIFDIHQTMTGMKNGYYEVHINAGFRPAGDIYSTNYAAKVYANDNFTYAKAVIEDMVPVDQAENRVNCWLEGDIADHAIQNEDGDTLGYVIWGVQSCCYAFQAGRYDNVVIAKVTDGTLTFGVKNEGTGVTGEWTGVGNVRVIYLGEDENEKMLAGMDRAIANNQERSATLQAYEGSTGEDYVSKPFFSQAERDALAAADASDASTAEAKYALLQNYASIFQSIYNTKPAYVDLVDAYLNVQSKWGTTTAMSRQQMDQFIDVLDGLLIAIEEGSYTAAEAEQRKADLYVQYPDYLAYDAERAAARNADITEIAGEPFFYQVTMKGSTPRFNAYDLYEDLTEDKNILALSYKSDKALEGGIIYFSQNGQLTTATSKDLPVLEATSEVKTVYFDISGERSAFAWNKKDSYLCWQLAKEGDFTVNVGKIRVITEAQMKAEGGALSISDVLADESVKGLKEGIYTLQGVRVEKATRGLYIINGQKVLVK